MTKIKNRVAKAAKIACVLAVSVLTCGAAMLSGCTVETDHPEATVTIKFNGSTYNLEYKLYRNMYPQTVRHFIELVENKFYNNTIIHDYKATYWYGGGYSYDAENYSDDYENSNLGSYLEDASKESVYFNDLFLKNKLTASVYRDHVDGKYRDALPTLIGEFTDNDHRIEPDTSLSYSYGCLRMYYTSNDSTEGVYLNKYGTSSPLIHDYKYNSATSLFSIQVGTSTEKPTLYCVFAELQNAGTLRNLVSDIATYMDDNKLSDSTFTSTGKVFVDRYDQIVDDQQVEYTLTKEPIIISSIKITKY